MKSALVLLSGLAATCLGAAVPYVEGELVARDREIVTVIVTITSTTTKTSSTKSTPKPTSTVVIVTVTSTVTKKSTSTPKTTAAPTTTARGGNWGPWSSGFRPTWWSSWLTQTASPVTVTEGSGPVTVYFPTYITVTATPTDDDDYAATVTLSALDLQEREEMGRPNHWRHSSWFSSWTQPKTSQDIPPSQSTVSTIYVYPTSTLTTTKYVTVAPSTTSSSPPRITFYPPRNAAPEPEPQNLGPATRTVLVSPTPPPPWWHWWPTATATATPIILEDRDVEERDPQELGFGSRTAVVPLPATTLAWTHRPPPKHSSGGYLIEQTATLSMLTLYKRDPDPQTLYPPTRTNPVTPTKPSYTHPHYTTSPSPSPSPSVSTIWVTITEWEPRTTYPYHHPTTRSTTNLYSTYTRSPTGTLIEATLTLPPFIVPTLDKREPQETFSLSPSLTVINYPPNPGHTSPPKEDPCHNPFFSPPAAYCSSLTSKSTGKVITKTKTVTSTYGGTTIEATATLPPLTLGTPPPWWDWRRGKGKRGEKRQQIVATQTRSFTFAPEAITTTSA